MDIEHVFMRPLPMDLEVFEKFVESQQVRFGLKPEIPAQESNIAIGTLRLFAEFYKILEDDPVAGAERIKGLKPTVKNDIRIQLCNLRYFCQTCRSDGLRMIIVPSIESEQISAPVSVLFDLQKKYLKQNE